jgi:(2Fe-2S) ferredoxin
MTSGVRCASCSLAFEEDPSGTASTVRAFLLLEHGGPWPVSVRTASLPDGAAPLLAACDAFAVRLLLVRRHRSRPGMPKHPRVALAVCDLDGGRGTARVLDARELGRLPLADLLGRLRAGQTADGWEDMAPVFLTCTHGRHDICCAERGRPVAAALEAAAGVAAWEVSHVGGDRFAANVLVLPEGMYYGRVTAERAAELVSAHAHGRCVPDLLRGRCALPYAGQYAEIALRRRLAVAEVTALRLVSLTRAGPRTTTTWTVDGRGSWRVSVDTTRPGPARPLTCSTPATAPPVHRVVELTELPAPPA